MEVNQDPIQTGIHFHLQYARQGRVVHAHPRYTDLSILKDYCAFIFTKLFTSHVIMHSGLRLRAMTRNSGYRVIRHEQGWAVMLTTYATASLGQAVTSYVCFILHVSPSPEIKKVSTNLTCP